MSKSGSRRCRIRALGPAIAMAAQWPYNQPDPPRAMSATPFDASVSKQSATLQRAYVGLARKLFWAMQVTTPIIKYDAFLSKLPNTDALGFEIRHVRQMNVVEKISRHLACYLDLPTRTVEHADFSPRPHFGRDRRIRARCPGRYHSGRSQPSPPSRSPLPVSHPPADTAAGVRIARRSLAIVANANSR